MFVSGIGRKSNPWRPNYEASNVANLSSRTDLFLSLSLSLFSSLAYLDDVVLLHISTSAIYSVQKKTKGHDHLATTTGSKPIQKKEEAKTGQTTMSNFAPSYLLESHHLIPQPSDLLLNPPQSYLFVQDFLIITCALLYLLCYLFYALRTVRDRRLAGPVEFMSATMAYEIFYAVVTTDTAFERWCFSAWFAFDVAFVGVALRFAYAPEKRRGVAGRTAGLTILWLGVFWGLTKVWPDEREQVTGFWTGVGLQLWINWGSLVLLWREGIVRGHSLEIW